MFPVGCILCQVAQSQESSSTQQHLMEQVNIIGENCRLVNYQQRVSAQKALSVLHKYI